MRESQRYSETTTSDAAIDGTHTHTLLDWCVAYDSIPKVGVTLSDGHGDFVVDQDRLDRVKVALDYIKSKPYSDIRSEIQVNPELFLSRADLGGTADIVIVRENEIEVIDYKDGFVGVEAEGNKQLEMYALGVLANIDTDFETLVIMTIIQPKLALVGGNPISSWKIPVKKFLTIERITRIKAEADATDDPNAPLIPGEEQCRWCAHRGSCSVLAAKSLADAGIVFQDLRIMERAMTTIETPNNLTNSEISEMVKAAPLIRQMLDAVEEECLTRMKAGEEVPDLKVVNCRGSRSWKDTPEVVAERLKKFGMRKEDYWKTTLITPLQAERMEWTNKAGVTKKLTEKQVKLMFDEYVQTKAGKLTVVPVSDSREGIKFNATNMFQPLEPEWMREITKLKGE